MSLGYTEAMLGRVWLNAICGDETPVKYEWISNCETGRI